MGTGKQKEEGAPLKESSTIKNPTIYELTLIIVKLLLVWISIINWIGSRYIVIAIYI